MQAQFAITPINLVIRRVVFFSPFGERDANNDAFSSVAFIARITGSTVIEIAVCAPLCEVNQHPFSQLTLQSNDQHELIRAGREFLRGLQKNKIEKMAA